MKGQTFAFMSSLDHQAALRELLLYFHSEVNPSHPLSQDNTPHKSSPNAHSNVPLHTRLDITTNPLLHLAETQSSVRDHSGHFACRQGLG